VALERLGSSGLDLLPVVSRADVRELLGVVTLRDILSSFGVAGSAGESSPRDRT
jgi:CBS domain-containing protein